MELLIERKKKKKMGIGYGPDILVVMKLWGLRKS